VFPLSSFYIQDFRLHLSFDYAAKSAAPLRTKMLLAERSEDVLSEVEGLSERSRSAP